MPSKVAVIIPTCNRPNLLEKAVENLLTQSIKIDTIIVVDSSDNLNSNISDKVEYIHSKIKSTAIQKNIGLNLIKSKGNKFQYLLFHDDDIEVDKYYVEKLIQDIQDLKAIGVSGVAINPNIIQRKESPLNLIIKKFFYIDSKYPGRVLKSGICSDSSFAKSQYESEWLIGCSLWNYQIVADLNFPKWQGYSLGEDVYFSFTAAKRGKLLVNPKIEIKHMQSLINRPNKSAYYEMWIGNRYMFLKNFYGPRVNLIPFHMANLAMLAKELKLSNVVKFGFGGIRGIFLGYRNIAMKNLFQ